MTVGYTMPKDWDDATNVHAVSSVVPLSVRNKAQQLIVAREERAASKQAIAKHMSGLTDAAIAKRARDQRYMAEVNAFFASKEQFPGATTPLPAARVVVADARRRRSR